MSLKPVPSKAPKGFEIVTELVRRSSWEGCDKCWKEGVAHNGGEAVFGGPCYIRLAWCDHNERCGFRLRPDARTCLKSVTKDGRGRWIWWGLRKKRTAK